MSRVSVSTILFAVFAALAVTYTNAFAPSSQMIKSAAASGASSTSSIHMGFGMPDEETKKLTRDNEPGANIEILLIHVYALT